MKSLLALMFSIAMLTGCASTGTRQSEVERITPEELAKILPPPVATVTLDEVVADSKAGKTSDEIIAKIKASQSRYELTPTQTLDLNKQGVDVKVLDYMHQSNELAKQNAIADELNKREQEKRAAQKMLQRQRSYGYYGDPFYYPYYGYYPYGSRFYWGPSFYLRYRR
jgi:hypothetical protein